MDQNTATEPRNRGGRPRVSEPGIRVSTWLSERDADKLIRIATKSEQSMSSLVRKIIAAKLR